MKNRAEQPVGQAGFEKEDEYETVADYVRSIPDFPEPGIIFRDVTPLMADKEAFKETIDRIC